MGGSSKSSQTTNQSQQTQTAMGSTPAATQALTGFTSATNNALGSGMYSGDVAAAPTQIDQYAPFLGDVSGMVADPGAALGRYTPNVNVLDSYIAGATPTSREGLGDAVTAARSGAGTISDTSNNMMDYWNQVSSGQYLDPNTNTALQNYMTALQNKSKEAQDQALAANRSAAISSGAYGGTGDARTNTWTNDQFDKNFQNTSAQVLYQNYMDEMARKERASAGSTDAFNLGQLPGQTLMGLGDTERGYNQLDINNQVAREQEGERAQGNDIQSQIQQRQDAALQHQAQLDNERGMAQWHQAQDNAHIQDSSMRAQVDQAIRQAGLTNDQSRYNAQTFGPMDIYQEYFNTLSNPVFGENSSGTSHGTSTTTTTPSMFSSIMGGLGAVANIAGTLTGNPLLAGAGAAAKGLSGGSGAAQVPGPVDMSPLQLPQIDYSQYFSSNPYTSMNGLPWYMQGAYNQPQILPPSATGH